MTAHRAHPITAGHAQSGAAEEFVDCVEATSEQCGDWVASWDADTVRQCDVLRGLAKARGVEAMFGVCIADHSAASYGALVKFVDSKTTCVDSAKMFLESLEWRDAYLGKDVARLRGSNKLQRMAPPTKAAKAAYEALGQDLGPSLKGYTVVFAQYSALHEKGAWEALFGSKAARAAFTRYRVEEMEENCRNLPLGTDRAQLVLVHDLERVPLKLLLDSKAKKTLSELFEMLNANYPEYGTVNLLVRTPLFVRMVLGFVSRYVSKDKLRHCARATILADYMHLVDVPEALKALVKPKK